MDDGSAVALAYNLVHRKGALDYPEWCAAMQVYRERHPDVPEQEAAPIVARLIADDARRGDHSSAKQHG